MLHGQAQAIGERASVLPARYVPRVLLGRRPPAGSPCSSALRRRWPGRRSGRRLRRDHVRYRVLRGRWPGWRGLEQLRGDRVHPDPVWRPLPRSWRLSRPACSASWLPVSSPAPSGPAASHLQAKLRHVAAHHDLLLLISQAQRISLSHVMSFSLAMRSTASWLLPGRWEGRHRVQVIRRPGTTPGGMESPRGRRVP